MAAVTMKQLLEAGVHFGHQTRRWNPKMSPYIYGERNGIHIIDLRQTVLQVAEAVDFARDVAVEGGSVLFVGTKKQAQEVVQGEAERCGMWYVNQRWLGGTLTNFQTIRSRINYMLELQQKKDQGYYRLLPKKEAVKLDEKLVKLEKYFLGIKDMTAPPAAIFVIDIGKEDICIAEAQRVGTTIFSIVDTDCDPEKIKHPIPANDDAVRSIRLITGRMANAVLEGLAQREAMLQEQQLIEEQQLLEQQLLEQQEREQTSDGEEWSEAEMEQTTFDAIPMDDLAQLMEQPRAAEATGTDSPADDDTGPGSLST